MHVYQLGWQWKHPGDFSIERPNGHFGMQLILVRSKGCIQMNDKKYYVDKNTAFIVESCFPHCIYGVGEEYADDWIRFSIDQEDHDFISSLNLQYNVPIPLNDESVSMLVAASVEIDQSGTAHKNETLDLILKAILLHISEQIKHGNNNKHNYYDEQLDKIKEKIYNEPAKEWNITDMAKELNISSSHFHRLYKNRYGISCMKDVFISRMQYAKHLLLTTDYSAKEIAIMCGYQNYEHFSRSFSKYACISPAQYRNKHKEK